MSKLWQLAGSECHKKNSCLTQIQLPYYASHFLRCVFKNGNRPIIPPICKISSMEKVLNLSMLYKPMFQYWIIWKFLKNCWKTWVNLNWKENIGNIATTVQINKVSSNRGCQVFQAWLDKNSVCIQDSYPPPHSVVSCSDLKIFKNINEFSWQLSMLCPANANGVYWYPQYGIYMYDETLTTFIAKKHLQLSQNPA